MQLSKWRTLKYAGWLSLSFVAMVSMNSHTEADHLTAEKEALNLIADFADRLCKEVPTVESGENLELSAEARGELNDFVKKLVDLGMKTSVKYQQSEYQGVLQKDLALALKNSTQCRLDVFEKLSDKLLERVTEVQPGSSPTGSTSPNQQFPAPTVQTGGSVPRTPDTPQGSAVNTSIAQVEIPSTDPFEGIGEMVSFKSQNHPERYIRHRDFLGYLESIDNEVGKRDATYRRVPGLVGKCTSFQSLNHPDRFLRHQNFRLKLAQKTNTQVFREDATFCIVSGLFGEGAVSFQSVNFPTHYIRHKKFELWLEPPDGNDLFRKDATFIITEPLHRD